MKLTTLELKGTCKRRKLGSKRLKLFSFASVFLKKGFDSISAKIYNHKTKYLLRNIKTVSLNGITLE